ncbi:MAG: hypothetical protein U0031_09900 [Thermomicrobiales bacterium]
MTDLVETNASPGEHLSWVRTRLSLERDLRETVAQGFALIVVGFGSFAIFDGLAENRDREDLPKSFALIVTVIGIAIIALGLRHFLRMAAWVDEDEFVGAAKVELPDERWPVLLASSAAIIGVISFGALLITQ